MVNLKVNYSGAQFELNLPTKINEITNEYLLKVTEHIHVAPDYSLIALVFKERPITIVSAVKQGKNATVNGVALMVKTAVTSDNSFVPNIVCGTQLIMSASDIAMGHHVNAANNTLNPNMLLKLLNDNNDLNKKCMDIMVPTYFVDFKVVPNCNIHGTILNSTKPIADAYFKPIE